MIGGYSYLRGELKHGSTNNQRCGVMFRCKGKRVRSINCPQTSVCQDRLRTNNDLKAENCLHDSSAPIALFPISHDTAYFIDTRHDRKYGCICDYCCFNASFGETCCHLMSL